MKAFVMRTVGEVGMTEKIIPSVGPDDALVKTTAAMICTSDSHTVRGSLGQRVNITLGHEAVGVVSEVGANVRHFKPGDRVVVGAITPDWSDPASQSGHPSQSGAPLGGWKFSNTKDGVFAEYFHVNQADANMALIPDDVSDEAAVYCADMMSTGFMGAENAHIPVGGTVAVFGEGPVGLMATAAARILGAGLVIGVEIVPKRMQLAQSYGADLVVDFSKENPVRKILELTEGEGVDSSIEAIGSDVAFQNCIKVTKPGGFISCIGYHEEGEFVHIPRMDWGVGMAEKTIVTGLCPGGRLRMERLLRLLEMKRIDPTKLTTHTFSFDQMERAFEVMDKKLEDVVKVLIEFP